VRVTSGGIYRHFSRSYLLPSAEFTSALVRVTSGGIYRHFSRSYLLPSAVFTSALVRVTSGGIYRHFSRVMISAAVFTTAIDLAYNNTCCNRTERQGRETFPNYILRSG